MLNFILIAVAVILLTIGLVKLVDKFIPSKFKPVLNIALWGLIIFLGYQTYMSIYNPILFNQEKNKRYAKVIEKLIDIRDAELAHKQVTGKFTDNFDELIKFIESAKYTITQRRDSSILDAALTKQFGVDMFKDIVIIDTLGFVSVKDSLFKNSNRYKTMMDVPVGKPGSKFNLKAGFIEQSDVNIPVFEASVAKDIILYDLDRDLVIQENQVVSVDGVNGNVLKVGSMEEVNTNGNWPKTYGSND
ncbi:hypothetical protein [Siansivirga zeaxanthinifaciens]|uniref:Uncharacterized protein n=1 Tax=Siansivirga zeaxanthinifaciens CC-SAMT-1 TaxID=1454006 RepID=A0A0C5VYK1_9FLAO|nr:hypothetical protein [Siansivirga zeaxanthinifaciens]AJR04136.1 hypothetical protein AW14_11270 [Siansivirga zeaxanthinifaciens CC-SAMT-1]